MKTKDRVKFTSISGLSEERIKEKLTRTVEANREGILECEVQIAVINEVLLPIVMQQYANRKNLPADQKIGKAEVEEVTTSKMIYEQKMQAFQRTIQYLEQQLELFA